MIVPDELLKKYGEFDADTKMFFDKFDNSKKLRILEVGSNEEYVSNILAEMGHDVTGFDLREYRQQLPCNYRYVRHDINNVSTDLQYDVIVALSVIEHIGLSTYGENVNLPFYDVIAMHNIWKLLKDNGVVYITVPFGSTFIEYGIHWRVYNMKTIIERIVQHFQIDDLGCFVSGTVDGFDWKIGDKISLFDASNFSGVPPHLTIFLKLRKVNVNVLSPNGR